MLQAHKMVDGGVYGLDLAEDLVGQDKMGCFKGFGSGEEVEQ